MYLQNFTRSVYLVGPVYVFFTFILIGGNPLSSSVGASLNNIDGESNSIKMLVVLLLFIWGLFQSNSHFRVNKNDLPALIVLAWAALSLIWSVSLLDSLRRVVLLFMLVYSLRQVVSTLGISVYTVIYRILTCLIALNIFTVVIVPSIGISELGWKGIHGHKNTLGLVSSLYILITSWLMIYSQQFRSKIVVFFMILACTLLVFSGSKTCILLCFLSLFTYCSYYFSSVLVTCIKILLITFCVCLPISFIVLLNFNSISEIFYSISDEFMTGRIMIWRFMLELLEVNPMLGVGYGAFWGVSEGLLTNESGWWVEKVGEGHSGYFDTVITLGIIGLTLSSIVLIACIASIKDRTDGQLILGLFTFIILYNISESALYNSTHIAWIFLILLVVTCSRGLHENN